jgi:hypothetical protein
MIIRKLSTYISGLPTEFKTAIQSERKYKQILTNQGLRQLFTIIHASFNLHTDCH